MQLRLDRALHRLNADDVSLSDFALDGRDSPSLSDAKNLGQGMLLCPDTKPLENVYKSAVMDPEVQKVNRTEHRAQCKCEL